jgi:hypothetical protein
MCILSKPRMLDDVQSPALQVQMDDPLDQEE